MRKLSLALLTVSLAAHAASGYPVYSMLSSNTYHVSMGTAFVVRYKDASYMVTNWHVCRYWDKSMAMNEKLKIKETTKILKKLPDQDLCIMTTDRTDGLEIGADVGEKSSVYTAGYPGYATTLQLRSGHTTYLKDEELDYGTMPCPKNFVVGSTIDPISKLVVQTCKHTQKIMDTNLEGTCGNSGSPVVNSKGQVVGVVHSRSEGKPLDDKHNTLNYIPVSDLVKALDSL